jgi:hypothetical protein
VRQLYCTGSYLALGHDEVTPCSYFIVSRATYCCHVTLLCAVVMEILQLTSVTVLEIRVRFIVLRTLYNESYSCDSDFRIVYISDHGAGELRDLRTRFGYKTDCLL